MPNSASIAPKPVLKTIDYYMVGISKLEGFSKPIKLSSNESALGMSPLAIEAGMKSLNRGYLYPEVDTEQLAVAIGDCYQLCPERMAFGPGSDELLQRIANTFAGPGEELIYSKNAYMQFPIYAMLAGATPVAADDIDFRYSVDEILSLVNDRTRVVLLANPDNPSGTYLTGSEMRYLHKALPSNVLLIIDAAYEEYARVDDYESGTNLVHEFDNVIVTRTFSKVHGMAGLRLGWCYGPEWVVNLITKIGPSFPANCTAYAAGIASLKDTEFTQEVLDHNERWIKTLISEFRSLGLNAYSSQTNFVLLGFPPECGRSSDEMNSHLKSKGIIVRQFALPDFVDKLRITVGTDEEMQKTIDVMQRFLRSA